MFYSAILSIVFLLILAVVLPVVFFTGLAPDDKE